MEYGVVFPQYEFGLDPVAIRDFAQAAESLGYRHILAYDHVLGANPDRPGGFTGPYTYHNTFFDPFVLFSHMAAVTERIGFISGILILPQRQTALVALQAASLDVLSGGRFRLGIGIGWNSVEYTALNEDFHTRGRRSEEQVEVLRQLWTQELVTYEGQWHTIPDAGLNPRPVQQPIPIWFGGHAQTVLDRVARLGDGWLPNHRHPADAVETFDLLDQQLAKHNRTRADIGIEPRIPCGEDANPADWAERLAGWQEAGATHVSFNTLNSGLYGLQQHLEAIQRFAEEIGVSG